MRRTQKWVGIYTVGHGGVILTSPLALVLLGLFFKISDLTNHSFTPYTDQGRNTATH